MRVLAIKPGDFPAAGRHVRDMWYGAGQDSSPLIRSPLETGSLVVFERRYDIDGRPQSIPGHIGIVTATHPVLRMIHASGAREQVVEAEVESPRIIGALAIESVF